MWFDSYYMKNYECSQCGKALNCSIVLHIGERHHIKIYIQKGFYKCEPCSKCSYHDGFLQKCKITHNEGEHYEYKQSDKTLRSDSSLPLDQIMKFIKLLKLLNMVKL